MGKGARGLSRTTKFDVDVLQSAEGTQELFACSNSRQIARGPDGTWLVLLRQGKKKLALRTSRKPRPRGEDFADQIQIVGDFQPAVFETSGRLKGMGGIVFDRRGALHLFWQEGRKVHEAINESVTTRSLKRYKSWLRRTVICRGKNPVLTDAVVDADGWAHVVCCCDDGVYVGRPRQRGAFQKVYEAGRNARLALDAEGGCHLVFEVDLAVPPEHLERVIYYLCSRDGESWTSADGKGPEPEVAAHAISWRPSLVCWRNRPLIVFQADGIKKTKRGGKDFFRQREGGGAGIGFAYHDGIAWRRGWVSKADEVLIRRITPVAPDGRYAGKLTPQVEEKWRPSLGVDGHGVPWAWWMDTTRRMSYWARWLGERFSEPHEHGGPFYRPTEFLSCQAESSGDSLGVVALADDHAVFDTAAAPGLRAGDDCSVLMLDLVETAEMTGLEHGVQPMAKFPGNPVFSPDTSKWEGPHVTGPMVTYDEERRRYCMRYVTGAGGWVWAYAESKDGIEWRRTAVEKRSGDNRLQNVIPFCDESESDPERRFKGYLFEKHVLKPTAFVTSPDAIHWRKEEGLSASRLQLPFTEPWGVSYLDAAPTGDGTYKIIGRTWHDSGRAVGMLSSADLFRWHGAELILDADGPDKRPPSPQKYGMGILESNAGPREEDQIYYAFSHGPVGGQYLLFYAPCSFDCRYSLSLASSRDGRHFSRVCGGQPLIPCGEAGEWDNGFIMASSFGGRPCRKGDEFRFYYGASGWHHGTDPHRPACNIGFASQLRDRWGYVCLSRNSDIGWLTTIPIDMSKSKGRALYLNVEGLERISGFESGGRVAAEFLDAETWTPIDGYACADCLPIEKDGLDLCVRWKDKRSLPRGRKCGVRLRIAIEGWTPKVFAFRFGKT